MGCATCVRLSDGFEGWFAPNVLRRACSLERTKTILQTHRGLVLSPDILCYISMIPAPYSDELPVPKPQNNGTVDRDTSDADEVYLDQVGERTDSGPTFGESGPSSQPVS